MGEGVDANIIGAAVGSNYWKQGERDVNKLVVVIVKCSSGPALSLMENILVHSVFDE